MAERSIDMDGAAFGTSRTESGTTRTSDDVNAALDELARAQMEDRATAWR
ncbi:hypothetical protein [Mycobacterium sp.]|nr:hypothetical protein [Mycobacterium sp.]